MSSTLMQAQALMQSGAFLERPGGPQGVVGLHLILGRGSQKALLTFTETLIILEDMTLNSK